MPFVAVAQTVRAALVFRNSDGNEAVNVIHINTDGAGILPATLNEMAIVIETWAEADWVDAAATTWTLDRVELRDLTAEDSYFLSYPIGAVGAAPGEALPSFNTVAISLRSGFIGRSRRGRLYHVGLSEGMVEQDELTAAGAVTLLNTYNSLRSTILANEWVWVVVSYVADGAPRVTPLVTPIASVILTDLKIDHQLRRSTN